MKIIPVILCGGAGTRLWPDSKKNLPKQFIDFGGWCLLEKTLNRIKSPIFDDPIICLLYTSPSPRDGLLSRMPSSA